METPLATVPLRSTRSFKIAILVKSIVKRTRSHLCKSSYQLSLEWDEDSKTVLKEKTNIFIRHYEDIVRKTVIDYERHTGLKYLYPETDFPPNVNMWNESEYGDNDDLDEEISHFGYEMMMNDITTCILSREASSVKQYYFISDNSHIFVKEALINPYPKGYAPYYTEDRYHRIFFGENNEGDGGKPVEELMLNYKPTPDKIIPTLECCCCLEEKNLDFVGVCGHQTCIECASNHIKAKKSDCACPLCRVDWSMYYQSGEYKYTRDELLQLCWDGDNLTLCDVIDMDALFDYFVTNFYSIKDIYENVPAGNEDTLSEALSYVDIKTVNGNQYHIFCDYNYMPVSLLDHPPLVILEEIQEELDFMVIF